MSTCKECIHEVVCDALIKTGLPWADGEYPAEAFCMAFKGKNDLVEVVRCKDCKHRNTPDCKMWYQCVICGDYHHWERDEYFCSYGERKE